MTPQEKFISKFLFTILVVGLMVGICKTDIVP